MDRKVSIIMSVYGLDNVESFDQAISSLLSQTYKNIEILIYKDGILPGELNERISHFELIDSRVRVFGDDINRGLACALNSLIGVILNEGESSHVARMDSDDICFNSRVERQLNYMVTNNLSVCGTFCSEFGSSYALDIKSLPTGNVELKAFSVVRCPFIHPTVMFDISVFEDGYLYPTDTTYSEDMALWLDLVNSEHTFGNLPEVLLSYRLSEDTINRRLGFRKALSEVTLRLKHMYNSNSFSFKNFLLIMCRFPLHLLPLFAAKFIYKYYR